MLIPPVFLFFLFSIIQNELNTEGCINIIFTEKKKRKLRILNAIDYLLTIEEKSDQTQGRYGRHYIFFLLVTLD